MHYTHFRVWGCLISALLFVIRVVVAFFFGLTLRERFFCVCFLPINQIMGFSKKKTRPEIRVTLTPSPSQRRVGGRCIVCGGGRHIYFDVLWCARDNNKKEV